MTKTKLCFAKGCHNILRPPKKKFCSSKCSKSYHNAVYHAKKKGAVYEIDHDGKPVAEGNVQKRRGKVYEQLIEKNLGPLILKGDMLKQDAAALLGCTKAALSYAYAAWVEDMETKAKAENWTIPAKAEKSLNNFKQFRDRYFLTETGEPYETPEFHIRWIKSILEAIEHGDQQMILSPPRHGKTDLLIHFAVWLIIKNPNVRILWVGGNEEIAKNAVSSVIDQLENNEKLIEELCPPGKTFKPTSRTGKAWSQNGFTVGTRTVTGIKSPTMVGIGRGGKILSRDCDIIIGDDLEDHSSTMQPASRENTRNWWTTTLSSRKEEHTAIIVIGSRQHYDDLYSHLLDNESWKTLVEEAHDTSCNIADWDEKAHTECMLWTGKRTYKWLMDRKRAAETTGGRAIYEMVYLNVAMPDGLALFEREEIEQCRDQSRAIGDIPINVRLIAGLDPASTGYQAAVLWGYNTETGTLFLIDIENNLGGGIPQALQIIKKWWTEYNCSHWVIEENGFQKAIRQDVSIKDFANRHGVFLEGHETRNQKFDPLFGVTAMRPMFADKLINLPYSGFEAQEKINLYTSQLVYFSSARNKSKSVGTKTDIVMASWFPMRAIRRMQKERFAELGYDYNPSFSDYNPSNIDYDNWR
tara:strand:+ start:1409 stop:3325 length:1917 start_codon:yes stop_codon:yes gene_type:complete